MKFWRKTTKVGLSVLAAVTIGVVSLGQIAQAATGSLYVSLSKTSVQKGDVVSANIRITPGTSINTVTATVTYNASQLSYGGISYGGSPFSTQIPGTVKSGSVSFSSAILGGSVSTDSFVAKLNFTVLASSGTSTIGLSGNAAKDGVATNPTVRGASMTIVVPAPTTCPAGQIGTPPNCHTPVCPTGQIGTYPDCHNPVCPTGQIGTYPNCHTPSCPVGQIGTYPNCYTPTCPSGQTGTYPNCHTPSPAPTPKPAPKPTPTPTPTKPPVNNGQTGSATGLEISSLQIQYTIANVVVSTNSQARVYIRYGLDRDALDTQTDMTKLGTTHKISFRKATILPGRTYYYQIVVRDRNGNVTTTKIDSFNTKGITVKIGVYDKNHKPLKHQKVTLHSTPQGGTTDDNGYVTFADVAPGSHTLTYVLNGKTYSQPLAVADDIKLVGAQQAAEPQSFSVVYGLQQGEGLPYVTIGAVLAGLLALAVIARIIKKRRDGGIYYGGGGGGIGGDPVYGPVTVGGSTSPSQPYAGPGYPPNGQSLTSRLDSMPQPQPTIPGTVITSVGDNMMDRRNY